MAAKAEILEILTETIAGLVQADGAQLSRLAEAQQGIAAPSTEAGRAEAVRLHRALGSLLVLTRRNLRVLGSARGGTDGFPAGRG